MSGKYYENKRFEKFISRGDGNVCPKIYFKMHSKMLKLSKENEKKYLQVTSRLRHIFTTVYKLH